MKRMVQLSRYKVYKVGSWGGIHVEEKRALILKECATYPKTTLTIERVEVVGQH